MIPSGDLSQFYLKTQLSATVCSIGSGSAILLSKICKIAIDLHHAYIKKVIILHYVGFNYNY